MINQTTVAVVGAGPTGLLLAGDLARAGVDEAEPLRPLKIDLSVLPTRFPYLLITPQYNVEQVLEKRATEAGARMVRGAQVTALRQDADGVELTVDGAAVRADYAVGADGLHSVVRARWACRSPAGRCRHPLPDTAPVTLEEIRDVTRRALGTDFGLAEARWMSRFHSDERAGHPVGRLVLRSSGAIIRMAMIQSKAGRLARNLLGGAALRLPPVAHEAAGTISGIGIDYPHAPRAQDVALRDSRRLYEVLRDGKFVLLAPDAARSTLDGWRDRVAQATPPTPPSHGRWSAPTLTWPGAAPLHPRCGPAERRAAPRARRPLSAATR